MVLSVEVRVRNLAVNTYQETGSSLRKDDRRSDGPVRTPSLIPYR